ncbi:two-component sensor histidine kinase (plasmid) [Rhizobium sp. ACO-34A]|nr:HAMP domain-containing sensor histidine kinase [Rhizobium sp. ACO-34A]ATN36943.1 two-component sensor histidine kinase [Rhizobium sp. ACO-34A]
MRRLFWKFFTIIWLTTAMFTAGAVVLGLFLRVAPFSQEVAQRQQAFALDVTEQLLRSEGEATARAFVQAALSTPRPVAMSISGPQASSTCLVQQPEHMRAVSTDAKCFILEIDRKQLRIFGAGWPKLVPWISILAASAVAAFWLTRYLIRPIAHLRRGLSALAHGRFDVRIAGEMHGRTDEVAALARDFDVSATRLQELQEAQQRLFHDVSHELRSPLSRLQAVVGVLRQTPAKLPQMMDRMDREIERIDGLVGEILTLARMASHSGRSEIQALDVLDLLNEILSDAAFEAQTRGIAVITDYRGNFVAQVNGELIYRALENVVRNAVKYAADNSRVTVCCRIEGDILSVAVMNEGPGVVKEDLERIFQPFSRGNDAAAHGGYGLGLAITKQAVERHGGRVDASIALGGGLTVTLLIPRSNKLWANAATAEQTTVGNAASAAHRKSPGKEI